MTSDNVCVAPVAVDALESVGAREMVTCGYCFHSDDTVRTSGGGGVCRDMDRCAANERADYEAMLSDKETI